METDTRVFDFGGLLCEPRGHFIWGLYNFYMFLLDLIESYNDWSLLMLYCVWLLINGRFLYL